VRGLAKGSRANQHYATSNFDTRNELSYDCVGMLHTHTHMHTQHCSAKRTNAARAFLKPQLMTQPDDGDNNLEKDRT